MTLYTSHFDALGKEKFKPIAEPLTLAHVAEITLPEDNSDWLDKARSGWLFIIGEIVKFIFLLVSAQFSNHHLQYHLSLNGWQSLGELVLRLSSFHPIYDQLFINIHRQLPSPTGRRITVSEYNEIITWCERNKLPSWIVDKYSTEFFADNSALITEILLRWGDK